MTMDPDWRTSRKHLYFLKGYLKPAPAPPVDLSEDFRESNEELIRRLVRDGALEVCGLQDLVAGAFRKDELQDLVRRHGGALEGSKTQLAKRALELARDEVEPKASKLTLFKCTAEGRAAYEALVHRTAAAEEEAKKRCFEFLLEGRVHDAFKEPARFYRDYVDRSVAGASLSYYGMANAERILGVKGFWALEGYAEPERRMILAAVAFTEAWPGEDPCNWVAEGLLSRPGPGKRVFSLVNHHAHFLSDKGQHALDEDVRLEFPSWIQACGHCKGLNGTVYRAQDLPDFPLRECTADSGCCPGLRLPNEEQDQAPAAEDLTSVQASNPGVEGGGEPEQQFVHEPEWSQEEVERFLLLCRQALKALIAKECPDFPNLDRAAQRTVRNRLIADHFQWSIYPFNDGILLKVDNPNAHLEHPKLSGLGVSRPLIDEYLRWRAGMALKSAFLVPPPTEESSGEDTARYEALLALVRAGMLFRGNDVPREMVLANHSKDRLKSMVAEVTRKRAPSRTKQEYIGTILEKVGSDFVAWHTRVSGFPIEDFFWANPSPKDLRAEETEDLALALRYQEALGMLLAADPKSKSEQKKLQITELYEKTLTEMAGGNLGETVPSEGSFKVAAPKRHICCSLCAKLNPMKKARLFHPGCNCGGQFGPW
jgi:hypothetical protein